jgi:D-galactarolactone cycloisomerase
MYFSGKPEKKMLEDILKEAGEYVEQGFRALKIKVGKNMAFDRKLIKAVRISFQDEKLMADSNHAYDLPEAVEIGRLLHENGYAWFEEPLSPQHPELFARLAEKVDVPIATGECEQTRYGFRNLLSGGGIHIAQPDLAYCGGPTEALKIRAVASSMGINTVPHCWGTQLNLASATHFMAAGYVEPGRAEPAEPLLEKDLTPNPMRDEIFSTALEYADGCVKVPTAPGLGVEPDRIEMEKFCIQKTEKTHAGKNVSHADKRTVRDREKVY